MLRRLKPLLACHIQAASHSLNFLCQKPWATMLTAVVIAITLALPTLFWVMVEHSQKLTQDWQTSGSISLYLKPGLTSEKEKELLGLIREVAGVGAIQVKSPEAGLEELTKQEGMQDIMRYLPENPLPAVVQVTPALSVDTQAKLEKLYNDLKIYPEVDQAKLDMQWVGRLQAILGFVGKVSQALILLLAIAVVLIIGNTLKLSLADRRQEIMILKLIGATDPYIVRPYLYSGFWYGLTGAVLAIFLVNIFIFSLGSAVSHLAAVYQMHYPLTGLTLRQILILILFSIILGWLGASLSVRRQLSSLEATL